MPTTIATPSQLEVDSLAAFIEAAGELELEPFCSPDEKLEVRHSVVPGHPPRITYTFGDRFHFRSALVSFRKVWLPHEASNFYRIIQILSKYEITDAWFSMALEEHRKLEGSGALGCDELTGKVLVDLWLNAVFAHNNLSQKNRNPKRYAYDRIDFDRNDETFGHAAFEFAFRQTVRSFSLCYLNLLRLSARPALSRWRRDLAVTPSFRIGAPFGCKSMEINDEGHEIIRLPSTEFGGDETLEQKLERFLSRFEFKPLASVLKQFNVSPSKLVADVLRANSFRELVDHVGFQLHCDPQIELRRLYSLCGPGSILAVLPFSNPHSSEIFVVAVDKERRILSHESAVQQLNERLQRLRSLF